MTKRVAIVQSNYIPWKGYFDLIGMVDEFILYDDRQYTKRDWRNRNRIKTPTGIRWLSIPVQVSGRFTQRIDQTRTADPTWADAHWRALAASYGDAPYFELYRDRLAAAYRRVSAEPLLSHINRHLLDELCALLGITTRLTWSSDYPADGERTDRLVSLCRHAGADEYLSGPAARMYLDESLFAAQGVAIRWMDYAGYPDYPQLHGPFDHAVSVLDLLFSVGPAAPRVMKSELWRQRTKAA